MTSAKRPRIALFVLEALPNARAARRFVADHAADIALVGLSNAERPSTNGLIGQVRRHLSQSGHRFLPYLALNFGLPDLLRPLAPVTQRLVGSLNDPEATPLATLCRRHGIRSMRIDDVNGPEVAWALRDSAADLIVTFHFDQILNAQTLALTPLGGLNVHPSLLPRHRGPCPTIYALAEGPDCFGVSVHRLVPAIDAGAILAQESVRLPEDVTATRAATILHEHGRLMLDALLDAIARDGTIPDGRITEVLPYCPFPSGAVLSAMRMRGLKLTDARDLREALSLHLT